MRTLALLSLHADLHLPSETKSLWPLNLSRVPWFSTHHWLPSWCQPSSQEDFSEGFSQDTTAEWVPQEKCFKGEAVHCNFVLSVYCSHTHTLGTSVSWKPRTPSSCLRQQLYSGLFCCALSISCQLNLPPLLPLLMSVRLTSLLINEPLSHLR